MTPCATSTAGMGPTTILVAAENWSGKLGLISATFVWVVCTLPSWVTIRNVINRFWQNCVVMDDD